VVVEFEPHPRAETPFPLGLRGNAHRPGNFAHRALVNPPPRLAAPKSTPWHRTTVSTFDQQGSSCTAQSAVGQLITLPHRYSFQPDRPKFDTEAERHAAYLRWQQWDPWPGGEPAYEGSSTDAPFIGLRNEGIISGWKFLFGEDELWEYVSFYGPAGVGTIWTEGMFWPDSNGFLHPTGRNAGGHAYEIAWASHARQAYRIINSWSTAWGQLGRAWITRADMRSLLAQDGEAVSIAAA
jgi:hypothetical protein